MAAVKRDAWWFVINYGWVILVVIAAIGALIYFGLLRGGA